MTTAKQGPSVPESAAFGTEPASDPYAKTAQFVAELIGGNVTSERVTGLVNRLSTLGIWLHGVKDYKNIAPVASQGVLRLTPEGGTTSFWASGWRAFASDRSCQPMTAFDTAFFHYGLSAHAPRPTMCLAITTTQLVGGELSDATANGEQYIALREDVLPSQRDLLVVQTADLRIIKELAFCALEEVVQAA